MPRQFSTAISDMVLAISVMCFFYRVIFANFFAAVGLAFQGAAASLGVVRFSMSQTDPNVKQYHQLLSWLAQVVGIPLLGIGFVHNIMPTMVSLNFLFILSVVIASRFLDDRMRRLLTEAASGFGMLTIIVGSLYTINIYGLVGAALYVASGLVIGSEGYMREIPQLSGVPRIDVLHYCLAVGNVFFIWALV